MIFDMIQNYLYHYGQGGSGGSAYNANLQAVIDYAEANSIAVPDAAALTKLSTLFDATASLWSKWDYFGVFAGHNTQAFGNINFKAPGTGGAVPTVATWTDAGGYKGNGSTASVDLGIQPGANFVQNSASLIAWCSDIGTTAGSDPLIGQQSGLNANLRNRNVTTHRINQANNTGSVTGGDRTTGLYAISRTGASAYTVYWPTGAQANTNASTAVLASNFCLLKAAAAFGDRGVAFIAIGSSIAQADYDLLDAALTTYLT